MKETRLPQNGKEGLLYGSIICLPGCQSKGKQPTESGSLHSPP